jgi:flagellin
MAAGTEAALAINGIAIASHVTSGTTSDGANVVAGAINDESATTGVTAIASNEKVSGTIIGGATADGDIIINAVAIDAAQIGVSDSSGSLVAAINAKTSQTNVTAALNNQNQLVLTGVDGANIHLTEANGGLAKAGLAAGTNYGTTVLAGASTSLSGATAASGLNAATTVEKTLSDIDVTSYLGAQTAIQITDMALKEIDGVRSNIGSTQNQLESTVRNISVTQVNVAAAESQIRDVDFAAESANFAKFNILAQSGSYAMSQANAVQQNVMRLLQ